MTRIHPPVTRDAVRFFAEHAGYVSDPRSHSAKRWQGGLTLARAERALRDSNLRVVWDDDDAADWSFVDTWDEKDRTRWQRSEHVAEWCRIEDEDGNVLTSLCGIVDADNDYRRVVAAELALEVYDSLTEFAGVDAFTD
jgi:hypothetical protein